MNKLDNPSNVKTSEDLPFCFSFQGYEFFFFFACAKKEQTNPVLFHYMLLLFFWLFDFVVIPHEGHWKRDKMWATQTLSDVEGKSDNENKKKNNKKIFAAMWFLRKVYCIYRSHRCATTIF